MQDTIKQLRAIEIACQVLARGLPTGSIARAAYTSRAEAYKISIAAIKRRIKND